MKRHRIRHRTALTLLEVILAMAILAGSFATLGQLVAIGIRAAAASRDQTQVQLLAESVLSEISAGVLPVENMNQVPLESHPGWLISAVVDNAIQQGMLRVTIIVQRDSQRQRSTYYEISRWMRDPSLPLPTEDVEETDEDSESSSATDNTTGSTVTTRAPNNANRTPAGGSGSGAPPRNTRPPANGGGQPRQGPPPGSGGGR